MQVFIKEGALVDETSDVPVVAFYPDGTTIVENMHGADAFVMYTPDDSIVKSAASSDASGMVMKQDWRSNTEQAAAVIDYEANRRINIAFPVTEQTKANAIINNYIITYGPDSVTWPSDAQTKKATITSGWNYVNAVTAAAISLKQSSPPLDPTDDAHWPAPITPIHL